MNARGIMDLIIIDIGMEKVVIRPTLFSMLELMAPSIFERVYGRKTRKREELGAAPLGA